MNLNEAVSKGNAGAVSVCASSSAALTLVQVSDCRWRDATLRALWVIRRFVTLRTHFCHSLIHSLAFFPLLPVSFKEEKRIFGIKGGLWENTPAEAG